MADPHPLQERLDKLSAQIERQIQIATDWKLALRTGIIIGFGTTIGAAILVSVLITVLKPFEKTVIIGPALERLTTPRNNR